MKAKIIELNGRYYMSVGGVIQYECDKEGNRIGEVEQLSDKDKQIEKLKQQIEQMKSDVIKYFGEENNMLVARLLKEWEKEVYHEGCPDVLCEDCTEEDCTVRKLGLVPTKEN